MMTGKAKLARPGSAGETKRRQGGRTRLFGKGRRGFTILAGLLALAGVTAAVFYVLSQPRTLRLAVGPLGSEDARMAAASCRA